MPFASMSTWRWYSNWLISSAQASGDSYSAAIQTSAASSTIFLPIECTPASSLATVSLPAGRVAAFSASSAKSVSKVFTGQDYQGTSARRATVGHLPVTFARYGVVVQQRSQPAAAPRGTMREVLSAFLRLGLTSFGGPVAHLGYFRSEFVARRGWISDRDYADLVALCQVLPGPASSQVGFGLGLRRAGVPGALAAFVSFTLPSALLMCFLAAGTQVFQGQVWEGALSGLQAVAVAVVAHAVIGMARTVTPDLRRIGIGLAALAAVLLWPGGTTQIIVISAGAAVGSWCCMGAARAALAHPTRPAAGVGVGASGVDATLPVADAAPGRAAAADSGLATRSSGERGEVTRRTGIVCLVTLGVLLAAASILGRSTSYGWLALVAASLRAGSLVFGGGHVVLPLLHTEFVASGWVSEADFTAGYGVAQAMPGPMFSFAAYLGAISDVGPGGALGAVLALGGVFTPGFLLLLGALPGWALLRMSIRGNAAVLGASAAVVGLLAAALVHLVTAAAGSGSTTLALALACGLALFWRPPLWLVVLLAAAAGAALSALGLHEC